jgi:poly(3-hydroxybutyrate) depolymerase
MQRLIRGTIAILLLAACDSTPPPVSELPRTFNIDRARITVSGVSSGAYMAGQLHIAHASLVNGAALIAGGPYACAGGSMQTALGPCIKGGDIDLDNLAGRIQSYADNGQIDDPVALRDDRVWIFHGASDQVVDKSVSQSAARLYTRFVDANDVAFVDTVKVVHGMPTVSVGQPCDEMSAPFLNACDYDAAGELLQHLYGPLSAPATTATELQTISQATWEDAQFWDHAYLYVPEDCQSGASCGLHVAFHGCRQSGEFVGDAYASGAGYNEWAETNRLIVLYPQVRSSKLAPLNPLGCWDWWGYTNEEYATRKGRQITAVRAMVDLLMRSRSR